MFAKSGGNVRFSLELTNICVWWHWLHFPAEQSQTVPVEFYQIVKFLYIYINVLFFIFIYQHFQRTHLDFECSEV